MRSASSARTSWTCRWEEFDGMGHAIPRAVVPPLAAALLSHIDTVGGAA